MTREEDSTARLTKETLRGQIVGLAPAVQFAGSDQTLKVELADLGLGVYNGHSDSPAENPFVDQDDEDCDGNSSSRP
jgi:hypothetical protein